MGAASLSRQQRLLKTHNTRRTQCESSVNRPAEQTWVREGSAGRGVTGVYLYRKCGYVLGVYGVSRDLLEPFFIVSCCVPSS